MTMKAKGFFYLWLVLSTQVTVWGKMARVVVGSGMRVIMVLG